MQRFPMTPYGEGQYPTELIMPQAMLRPEVEEALLHASPETMRAIKGTIFRVRAMQTAKEALALGTAQLGTAIAAQAQLAPLYPGESMGGDFAIRIRQGGGPRYRENPSMTMEVSMRLWRSNSGG
ncbi:hypothetical protein HZA87_06120 [Candidatus Uhrbacteria bacterium]|nr:hypothetical protein [Candidatus Uhrbacteria bacterium]